MDFIKPRDPSNGRSYENTILGALLSISCIVKNDNGPYEFFDKPSSRRKQEHDITEANIHHVSIPTFIIRTFHTYSVLEFHWSVYTVCPFPDDGHFK